MGLNLHGAQPALGLNRHGAQPALGLNRHGAEPAKYILLRNDFALSVTMLLRYMFKLGTFDFTHQFGRVNVGLHAAKILPPFYLFIRRFHALSKNSQQRQFFMASLYSRGT